jgi:hypothetical protein
MTGGESPPRVYALGNFGRVAMSHSLMPKEQQTKLEQPPPSYRPYKQRWHRERIGEAMTTSSLGRIFIG